MGVYSSTDGSSSKYKETKEQIVLRKVVHELLLASGDSVSRVLPVKQITDGEFHLFPERPLSINPDSFVHIVNKTVQQGNLLRNFTANVVKCKDKETVFGFAASPVADDNVVTCLGTQLPEDCYYLSFIFSPEKKSFLSNHYFYFGLAAMALTGLFIVWWRKRKIATAYNPVMPETVLTEEDGVKPNHISIGKYFFNLQQQYLELDGEKTALTIKECKVLTILANAPNEIVEREMLQKEVWENEGVIVTRSLDMFISKLRKKLSGDADIKIMNVHGKGYRLSLSVNT